MQHFTASDYGVLMICFVSIGIVGGVLLYSFFTQYWIILFIIAIITLSILIYRIIKYHEHNNDHY